MSFSLFGFDFFVRDRIFGFWLCGIKDDDCNQRSLLCVYFSDWDWRIDVLFIRVL